MSTIRIKGVAATTHPLDAYGGFQASVEEVESVVEGLIEDLSLACATTRD
jgi:hypothetical protein